VLGQIWAYTHFGHTPFNQREYVHGASRVIDLVAEECRRERPDGGRFFINDDGAFYNEEGGPRIQFVVFQFQG
jgi:hypothetical protein